jgi:site-specific recombinase XerD
MNQRLQIYFFLKKSKTTKKGTTPIVCRLSIHPKRVEFYTGLSIDEPLWNNNTSRVLGKKDTAKGINSQMDAIESRIRQIYASLIVKDNSINVLDIYAAYSGKNRKLTTLNEVIDAHNVKLKERLTTDRSKVTYNKYIITTKHVKLFLKSELGVTDIPLQSLNAGHLLSFQQYLLKQSYHHNTVMKHAKNFRRYLNYAMEQQWINYNPFMSVKCGFKPTLQDVLDENELRALMDKTFTIERLEKVRNCFLFMCYTGLAYIDLKQLEHKNLELRADGLLWISIQRTKTEVPVCFPLLSHANDVLNKMQPIHIPSSSDKLFKIPSNQKMNGYLAEIGSIVGINKKLVCHLARRTFASTVLLKNGTPIEIISKLLGHLKISTTQIYAKVGEQLISTEMKKLEEKLTG